MIRGPAPQYENLLIVGRFQGPGFRRREDADLAAAAPDMLAAIEYALLELGTIGEVTEATFQRLKAAHRAAKGRVIV